MSGGAVDDRAVGPDGESRPLLIYDGQCRLCLCVKEGLERSGASDHVRFVPYQSEEATSRLGVHHQPGRPDVAFLLDAQGRLAHGLDAFLPLLPLYPGGRLLQRMLRIRLVRWMAKGLYWLVARYRYRLFGAARHGR